MDSQTKYVLTLDQGTTSSRALLVNKQASISGIAQQEFKQIFPRPGWVEHNPEDIWNSQLAVLRKVIIDTKINTKDIAGIGITNQRETTILWDKRNGKTVYNAIVWQDRRTSKICEKLISAGHEKLIRQKTGLPVDAYFSATKIKWIFDNVDGIKQLAASGNLAFGTVDTWLIWNLTSGKVHATDVSNASRTMLFNINTLAWDKEILEILDIPASILPEVKASSELFGYLDKSIVGQEIPICGIAGDQQAALFGQACHKAGMMKNTYGTGAFIMMNTGDKPARSENNLISTIAWQINGKTTYALEGSVFVAGAVIQWLKEGLGLIKSYKEVEELAISVEDNGDVYFVPAFTGLGAPHWNQEARGAIFGLTRGTKAGHIARAALESIAFQTKDVLNAMKSDSGLEFKELRVDGGATANNFLMKFQADVLGISLDKPVFTEATALGAAFLAGLYTKLWNNIEEIEQIWKSEKTYLPSKKLNDFEEQFLKWQQAVNRSKNWA